MAGILVIDDDTDFGQSLKSMLEEQGHHAQYVERAKIGLESISNRRFDVVLLDNRMPGMTGIEFLKVLQEQEEFVPVRGHRSERQITSGLPTIRLV